MLSCLFWCPLAGVVASWQLSLSSCTVRHPRHDPNCSVPFHSLCGFLLAPERTLTHPIREAAFPIFLFLLRGIFPKQLLHLLLGGSQRIWSISLPLTPGKGMALPAHSPFPAALATKGSVVFLSYVTCVHACSQTETSLAYPGWPSRHLEYVWAYVEYVGIWEYVGTSGSAAEDIPAGSALWFIKSRRRKTSWLPPPGRCCFLFLFLFFCLFSNAGVEVPLQNCHLYPCSDKTWRLLSQCKFDREEFMTDF